MDFQNDYMIEIENTMPKKIINGVVTEIQQMLPNCTESATAEKPGFYKKTLVISTKELVIKASISFNYNFLDNSQKPGLTLYLQGAYQMAGVVFNDSYEKELTGDGHLWSLLRMVEDRSLLDLIYNSIEIFIMNFETKIHDENMKKPYTYLPALLDIEIFGA